METTNGVAATTTPAAASSPAPAASSTPAASPAVSSTPAASPAPVQDGQRGAGALTPDQSVEAMLSAVQNKHNSDAANASTVETPVVTDTTAAAGEKKDEPAATEATPGAGDTQDDGYTFEEDGFVGARDLAAKIDGNEALKAALPDDVRGEIMANARIAEQLAPFREIFGSPEEAKIVAAAAQEFAGVQQIFSSIHGDGIKQGTSSLLSKMLEMSALRDEQGNPRKRADGSFVTDGTTTNFLNELYDRAFNTKFVKKVEDAIAKGDDALKAAFDLVMERAGLRTSTADQGQSDDPAITQRKAELDRQQKEINDQKAAARKEREQQFTDTLNTSLQSTTDGAINSVLGRATGLNDFTRKTVVTQLTRAIKDAIKGNTAYWMEKDKLALQPMTPQRHAAEVKLAKDFLLTHLPRIAKPILAEAGATIATKAGERAAAQAARAESARGEVQGGTPTQGRPAADAANPNAAREVVRTQLKEKLGRDPSDSEVNVELMLNLPALKNRGRAA
jgi:hypothetical protein